MKNRHHFDQYGIELNAFDFKVFKNTISGRFYSFDEENKPIDEIYLIKVKSEKTGQTSVNNYTKTIKKIFKKNRSDYNNVSNENEKKLLEYLSSFDIVPIYLQVC